MKTSDHAIDRKKFMKFWERVHDMARRLFPDEGDGSYVEVKLRDCTRETQGAPLIVASSHLLETDEEWRDAISSLSCNVKSAADTLDVYLRLYNDKKRSEEGLHALQDEIVALAEELHCVICLGHQHKAPGGMRWDRPFADVVLNANPNSFIRIDNLYACRKEARTELFNWVREMIKRWGRVNFVTQIAIYPPFKVVINDSMAHLMVAVDVNPSKTSKEK